MASHFADELDDDSRIDMVDVDSLASRNQLLLVTSAGVKDCITATVFLTGSKRNFFRKLWSIDQTPNGTGFCATRFGRADVKVLDGIININIPDGQKPDDPAVTFLTVYQYLWSNGAYRYVGKRPMSRARSGTRRST
jgi:hypothetical protein